MPEAVNIPIEDGLQRNVRRSFFRAGIDDFLNPPAQDPDSFTQLENVITGVKPGILRRWGTTLFSQPEMNARRIFETHFANGRNRFVLTAADQSGAQGPENNVRAINENGDLVTTAGPIFVPSVSAAHPVIATSRNYCFFTDGQIADLLMWDTNDDPTAFTVSIHGVNIPSVTTWGIETPTTALTATETAEGSFPESIYLVDGRSYTYIYRNSVSGETSDIAPFTDRFGAVSDPSDPSLGLHVILDDFPLPTNPKIDEIVLLATADGGAQDTLYEVAVFPNTNGTTWPLGTYEDSLPEADLINKNIWAERGLFGERGVINNTPPSEITNDPDTVGRGPKLCEVFRGRMFIVRDQFLFWSKNLSELITSTGNVTGRWETCFPIGNQTSISSNGSEVGTSLRTDDTRLYIGTNRAVYILDSDQPGFNPPRALFQEVGVLNDAVWTTIYHEGTSVGAIWMTPDHRIIYSDFASYRDIGNPIQTALGALPSTIATTATATFVADEAHEFYLLAPGGGDPTVFIYNVKTGRWFKWSSAFGDAAFALSYMWDSFNHRILPIFSTSSQRIYRWNKTTHQDQSSEVPQLPAPVIKTNWLDFGDPSLTKVINRVEIQTDEPTATLTVEGARNETEFDTPVVIVSARAFTQDIWGNLVAMLAERKSDYRFFRFTFGGLDDSPETNLLSYWAIEGAPISHL